MDTPNPSNESPAAEAGRNRTDAPVDLRDWLERIEEAGELQRITAPVRLDEELGAITYMMARDEAAPALMFDNFEESDGDVRIVSNMLGASRRRFAKRLSRRCIPHSRRTGTGWRTRPTKQVAAKSTSGHIRRGNPRTKFPMAMAGHQYGLRMAGNCSTVSELETL